MDNISQTLKTKIKMALWRWIVRKLRLIVDAADEWIHAEEVKIRTIPEPVAVSSSSDEYQFAASRAREKQIKKAARAARPRLRYVGGEFVRVS